MRIILDTDKKLITVPWNYRDKLAEINRIAEQYGGGDFKPQTFSGYIDGIWKACMADTDKHLKVADKPKKKEK